MDVLYFHKLPPLEQFGVLIALSIAYSFLASAYVLPTFLILWAKWKKNRGKGPEVVEYDGEHEEQGEEDDLVDEEKESPKHDLIDEEKESLRKCQRMKKKWTISRLKNQNL